jgi:hypothetical protein
VDSIADRPTPEATVQIELAGLYEGIIGTNFPARTLKQIGGECPLWVIRDRPSRSHQPAHVRFGPKVTYIRSCREMTRCANRDILSDCREYVVRCQGASDPLQPELSHWLDLYRILDLRQHSRTDQDLPRLSFIA